MMVVTTIDVFGLTEEEYGRVMNRLGVEAQAASGIFLHISAQTEVGYRVTEIWDSEDGFRAFLADRLGPAAEAERIEREMKITVEPLHNFFGPRLSELPASIPSLPGSPANRN